MTAFKKGKRHYACLIRATVALRHIVCVREANSRRQGDRGDYLQFIY